jgi:hypothetical protein
MARRMSRDGKGKAVGGKGTLGRFRSPESHLIIAHFSFLICHRYETNREGAKTQRPEEKWARAERFLNLLCVWSGSVFWRIHHHPMANEK